MKTSGGSFTFPYHKEDPLEEWEIRWNHCSARSCRSSWNSCAREKWRRQLLVASFEATLVPLTSKMDRGQTFGGGRKPQPKLCPVKSKHCRTLLLHCKICRVRTFFPPEIRIFWGFKKNMYKRWTFIHTSRLQSEQHLIWARVACKKFWHMVWNYFDTRYK